MTPKRVVTEKRWGLLDAKGRLAVHVRNASKGEAEFDAAINASRMKMDVRVVRVTLTYTLPRP